jgi:hypothetical protein
MQDADATAGADVDAEIEKELAEMREPASEELFTSVRLDTQCRQLFSVILAHRLFRRQWLSSSILLTNLLRSCIFQGQKTNRACFIRPRHLRGRGCKYA